MSQQTNFFADPDDTDEFHIWLIKRFPDLKVVPKERGHLDELRPTPAIDALDSKERMYLLPRWAEERVTLTSLEDDWDWITHDLKGWYRVDFTASPVIEYRPCRFEEGANSVIRGRLYWGYQGKLSPEHSRDVNSVFRWIRTHSVSATADGRFKVLEHTARNRRVLDFEFGTTQLSPNWDK